MLFRKIPLNIRNTIRKVISAEITKTQHEYTCSKQGLSRTSNRLRELSNNNSDYVTSDIIEMMSYMIGRRIEHLHNVRKLRSKLASLHNINWYLKYPSNTLQDEYVLIDCEAQTILHYLRTEASSLYGWLEGINEDINYQKTLAINDGTLQHKLEFIKLNLLQNERRKVLRKIKSIEQAIKVIKLSLKGKARSKKPLTFVRRVRKLWYNIKSIVTLKGK